MVSWEVPIGAAIAFAGGAMPPGGHSHGLVQPYAERPETAGTIIILDAIPETLMILGFGVASMIVLMVK